MLGCQLFAVRVLGVMLCYVRVLGVLLLGCYGVKVLGVREFF